MLMKNYDLPAIDKGPGDSIDEILDSETDLAIEEFMNSSDLESHVRALFEETITPKEFAERCEYLKQNAYEWVIENRKYAHDD